MSISLLESDFLTTDLSALFREQKPVVRASKPTRTDTEAISDWGAELEKQLANNRALTPEARIPDFEIEKTFWQKYFQTIWADSEVAKQLISLGDALRKAIKILGFDKTKNPILAFIQQNYVQEALLKTKLLNANTYKAIHQAVAKKLVAQSEFEAASDYNIIYCKDLYTKSASEMEKYLIQQEKILNPNSNFYSTEIQANNKQRFLQAGFNSMQQDGAKLKDLRDLQDLKADKKAQPSNTHLQTFIDSLKSKAEIQAAFQYIGTHSSGEIEEKALDKIVFTENAKDLLIANKKVTKALDKFNLSQNDATTLFNMLEQRVGMVQ